MTTEYIRYTLTSTPRDQFIAGYQKAAAHLQAAPECLGYDLTACEEEPSSFILRIRWKSTQAHLEGFRKGPHFAPFFAAVKPFFSEITEMRHYGPVFDWTR